MRMFAETVAENARRMASKPCIVLPDGETALTYGELDRQATAFAGFLLAHGGPRGGRLLIAIHNTPEFFVVMLAALRAAMVAVPVDSNLAIAELVKIVDHADPDMIVVNETSAPKFADVPAHRKRIAISGSAPAGAIVFDPAMAGDTLSLAAALPSDETAMILYTSGTTGTPKGVMHSHAGLTAKLETIRAWFAFDSSFHALCLLPTHFGHGLICNCLATLNYGGTLVLCRPFDLDLVRRLWDYVETNQVNTFSTVPAVIRLVLMLAERSPPPRVPSLKFVTCASAPLRPEDIRAFEARFGVPLLNCYGITETASWTAFSPPRPDRDLDSVGIRSGCDIRAVDSEGHPLAPGETGELQIRGPSVMLGYYKDPELTAQMVRDGWFATGDTGRVDEAGRVYILGRIKELIIRAGLNVYPADVDAVLLSHPQIAEAYCVGLQDALLGEKVAAVVVRKPESSVNEQSVIDFCRQKLAAYKCPDRVVFVAAVPKTSRGKVNRGNLRPLFQGHS